MNTRTAIIEVTPEDFLKRQVPNEAFYKALGYLATWGQGSPRYRNVIIYSDRADGDMVAVYKETPEGKSNFVLGAVWDKTDKTYSFHS